MKKRNILLMAAVIGLTLTACGNSKETTGVTSGNTVRETDTEKESVQEQSQEHENLPASQEYISSDGTYKVILLEGLRQTDMPLSAGSTLMGLDGDSERKGFTGVSLRCSKTNVLGNSDEIENLEDFADYIATIATTGSGVTISWEDTDAPSMEGVERCMAKKGVARNGAARGLAYGYYAESADSYYSVVVVGSDDDVEEAIQITALEILDEASGQKGTGDFINAMTAVLDSVNGANIRETFKALEDAGADEDQLDAIASQAQQSLSSNWGVENADDLMEMADWLMTEGHNQDALNVLELFHGINEPERDAFESVLEEQDADDETYVRMMAAYDAWTAYGDGAIAAWDLSRIGTIMSFGYASGYCTYEEAMDKMLDAALKSQELFDSWEDFNKSYLYGYSFWTAESLDDAESSAGERAKLVSDMEAQANGPYCVDWNIELMKEW